MLVGYGTCFQISLEPKKVLLGQKGPKTLKSKLLLLSLLEQYLDYLAVNNDNF